MNSSAFEFRIVRPDGALRWVRESADVLREADGTPWLRIGVVQDITAQKAWEAALTRVQEGERLRAPAHVARSRCPTGRRGRRP